MNNENEMNIALVDSADVVEEPAQQAPEETESESKFIVDSIQTDKFESPKNGDETDDGPDDDDEPPADINQILSADSMRKLVKAAGDMAQIYGEVWSQTRKEFSLREDQMKEVYQYNIEHRQNMPEGLTKEERDTWDACNGLNDIPEVEVVRIFGEGHPIISPIAHSVTIDRLKGALMNLIEYVSATRELRDIYSAHSEFIDGKDEAAIFELRAQITAETDPEKKEKMQAALDEYESYKYLDFLKDALPEDEIIRIIKALKDRDKINYYLTRCRENLKEFGLSDQIILALSQLEKRLLPEKYHKLNNLFLLYYVYMVTYCKPNNDADPRNRKIVSLTIAMDLFVRKAAVKETLDRMMVNVQAFEDQFLSRMVDTPEQ